MNTYELFNIENTHEQNLQATSRTQKMLDLGKDEIDIDTAESVHSLVNQVALYRGVSLTVAKKIISQILREVTK